MCFSHGSIEKPKGNGSKIIDKELIDDGTGHADRCIEAFNRRYQIYSVSSFLYWHNKYYILNIKRDINQQDLKRVDIKYHFLNIKRDT